MPPARRACALALTLLASCASAPRPAPAAPPAPAPAASATAATVEPPAACSPSAPRARIRRADMDPDVWHAVLAALGRLTEEAAPESLSCEELAGMEALRLPRVASLRGVGALSGLASLAVEGVADGDLTPVTGLGLRSLDLGPPEHAVTDEARVSVRDWSPLASLASLETLRVRSAGFAATEHLVGLRGLRSLDLARNAVSDLAPLAELTALERVNLGHNRVADVMALAGLPRLESLDLRANPLADVAPLAGATALATLVLDGTAVRDASPLLGVSTLRQVVLCGTPALEGDARAANAPVLRRLRARGVAVPDVRGCHCC